MCGVITSAVCVAEPAPSPVEPVQSTSLVTGHIKTLAVLDAETKAHYWLTVYAQDHGVAPLSSRLELEQFIDRFEIICPEQFGFRRDKSTIDAVTNLFIMLSMAWREENVSWAYFSTSSMFLPVYIMRHCCSSYGLVVLRVCRMIGSRRFLKSN
ncbi:hypothetical protein J6590_013727 [Homalodisca vitripennis]|nr:hypothetical protein J6590_013727 [Homalodisca vitripennis]